MEETILKEYRAGIGTTTVMPVVPDVRAKGKRLLSDMQMNSGRGIVLAGLPYHIDPEINHVLK